MPAASTTRLQGGEEASGGSVPAHASPADAGAEAAWPGRTDQRRPRCTAVPVGVEDPAGLEVAVGAGYVQRVGDQAGTHVVGQLPATTIRVVSGRPRRRYVLWRVHAGRRLSPYRAASTKEHTGPTPYPFPRTPADLAPGPCTYRYSPQPAEGPASNPKIAGATSNQTVTSGPMLLAHVRVYFRRPNHRP